MPVLVDGPTWIARRSTLEALLPGGAEEFAALAPPGCRCADAELVAVSFATAQESRTTARVLQRRGLVLLREDGAFQDAAVLHHRFDPGEWCPWLELAPLKLASGGSVLTARAEGSTSAEIAVPESWQFEGSASAREGVVRLRPADRPLRFLRREPDAAVYRDRFTGEEVRVEVEGPVRVIVETAAGARHEVVADVVRTGNAIELGLMHRERLDPGAGMLFHFGRSDHRSFWMKNTLVPLDLVFVRSDGVVVNVVERAQPLTLFPCLSAEPCATVLEVNGGWAAAHGIAPGDRVTERRE